MPCQEAVLARVGEDKDTQTAEVCQFSNLLTFMGPSSLPESSDQTFKLKVEIIL